MNKVKTPLKVFAVRADENKVREAQKLGIDLGKLFRLALDVEILKFRGTCPTCSQKRKHV